MRNIPYWLKLNIGSILYQYNCATMACTNNVNTAAAAVPVFAAKLPVTD